jgi:hypothetical protein
MSASPVRRCVAVASHGKRCQQSPFRGSPYCWHHLQSRKVPATSRPLRVAPAPGADAGDAAPLPSVDRMALAAGIAQHMRAEDLAELLRFVESSRDGTLVLVKQDGRIVDAQIHRPPRLDGAAAQA